MGSYSSGISNHNGLSAETKAFFGLAENATGLWMRVSGPTKVNVFSGAGYPIPEIVGTIDLLETETTQYSPAITVHLPEGQQVFKMPASLDLRYLPGPIVATDIRKGIYRSVYGQIKREVILHVTSHSPEYFIGAVVDGKFISISNIVH